MVLKLRELHVPTIIGVNGNERKARQVIVVSVEMERWDRMVDAYNELEEIVVKVSTSSSPSLPSFPSSSVITNSPSWRPTRKADVMFCDRQ